MKFLQISFLLVLFLNGSVFSMSKKARSPEKRRGSLVMDVDYLQCGKVKFFENSNDVTCRIVVEDGPVTLKLLSLFIQFVNLEIENKSFSSGLPVKVELELHMGKFDNKMVEAFVLGVKNIISLEVSCSNDRKRFNVERGLGQYGFTVTVTKNEREEIIFTIINPYAGPNEDESVMLMSHDIEKIIEPFCRALSLENNYKVVLEFNSQNKSLRNVFVHCFTNVWLNLVKKFTGWRVVGSFSKSDLDRFLGHYLLVIPELTFVNSDLDIDFMEHLSHSPAKKVKFVDCKDTQIAMLNEALHKYGISNPQWLCIE